MLLWLGFILCTGAIVYSGTQLSRYGDILAEKTGLGRTWIGVVLTASVTSLPELVNGISSVTFAKAPNIAVGDILGSCVFNLFILALIDLLHPRVPVSSQAHHGHVLSAGFGILLLGIVGLGIAGGKHIPALGWLGINTILVTAIYLLALRLFYFYEKRRVFTAPDKTVSDEKYKAISLEKAGINYGINATIVILAAIFLPKIGKGIAATTGLGQPFVGNIFIAISTSLPELVVTFAALKIGALDLAVGDLFGSNVFNIFILALDDIVFIKGPLLTSVNSNHIISCLAAIAMTSVAIIGLTYRAEKKPLFLAWDSFGLIAVFLANIVLLYILR